MKYTTEVWIKLDRPTTIALFDNPDNLARWQKDLIGFEPMDGIPGQAGSQMRLTYRMGKRELEMVETIVTRDFPDRFIATYEAKGVWNQCHNTFKDKNGGTHWQMETEFRFSGWMKLMGWLMPGMFKKQTRQSMADFKAFAEGPH